MFLTEFLQNLIRWEAWLQGFSWKVEKCWQNNGDGGGAETVTRGDLINNQRKVKQLWGCYYACVEAVRT